MDKTEKTIQQTVSPVVWSFVMAISFSAPAQA